MKYPTVLKTKDTDLHGLIQEYTQDILKEIKASYRPEWF